MKKYIPYVIIVIVILLAGAYITYNRSNSGTEKAPTDTTAAKLNINVVCDSALSYMSFPDGASASAFVAECKEGKHPEVIEHYKAQMNLGNGATI